MFTPPPDTAEDLVRTFGITREEAGDGSPDLAWLLTEDGGEAHLYAAGDRLPIGIEALLWREHNDLVLWMERAGAVISGDTLVDFGRGFEINESLRGGRDPRTGRRATAAAASAAGRVSAPDARSTNGPCHSRACPVPLAGAGGNPAAAAGILGSLSRARVQFHSITTGWAECGNG